MSTEKLNLWLAAAATLLTAVAVVLTGVALKVASKTLNYMRGRDLEVDTRTGWIEIHKAMVNLRVQRSFVMLAQSAMGAYLAGGPNQAEERIRSYTLAAAQLRGQLDRLNDDPLVVEVAEFLDENISTTQWQTAEYEKAFDAFVHKVAFKSRPR
jgi:hypothetical protein